MSGMIVAALAALQQPDAKRLEEVVRASAERRYVLRQRGTPVGTRIIKAVVEKDVVAFSDEYVSPDGKVTFMSTRERASLSGLRLLTVKRTMQGTECAVKVEGGKASVEMGGRKTSFDVTEGTIGECSFHMLLSALPQKDGTALKVDFLEPLLEQLMKGMDLRCVAKETLEVGGKKVECFRWELKWEKREETESGSSTTRREDTYWVDASGRIRRIKAGDEVEMDLEEVR